ncbi:MAG: 2-hydroxyacyl-CoA dehydratase subunit D [Promethearchaeota archaeon]|jgi:benzoyl-CoA reductase/2-hydroxyglutaryl-CoA dehydratase subunit BcrC/BadD/HgdB
MNRQRIRTLGYLNELLIKYYNTGKDAQKDGKKIAYVSVGFPVELLYAIDIIPYFPQNHAAFYSVQRKTCDIIGPAESVGLYSMDLCSEIKGAIGIAIAGENLSFKMPQPDVILAASNICGSITKCTEALSRYYNVPHFSIDMPFVSSEITLHSISFVKSQFKELMSFLEKISGREYDHDKLKEICRLSWEGLSLWKDIIEMAKRIPTPVNGLDIFTQILPITTLRGTEDTIKYYQRLKEEIEFRVHNNISAIPEEKYRLFWDYLPIYHKMKYLSRKLAKHGACVVVASFFFPAMEDDEINRLINTDQIDYENLTLDTLLDFLAYGYLSLYANRSIEYKVNLFTKLAREFSIDGFILHVDRSCKPQSLPQYEIGNLMENDGYPTVVIDADSMDPRYFSEAQVDTRLEAFIETLENRKREG